MTLQLSKMMAHVITSAALHLAVQTHQPAIMTQVLIMMMGLVTLFLARDA